MQNRNIREYIRERERESFQTNLTKKGSLFGDGPTNESLMPPVTKIIIIMKKK
jgi:hypothetical protein